MFPSVDEAVEATEIGASLFAFLTTASSDLTLEDAGCCVAFDFVAGLRGMGLGRAKRLVAGISSLSPSLSMITVFKYLLVAQF